MPTAIATVTTVGLGAVVNYATNGGQWWLWLVAGALTLTVLCSTLWLEHSRSAPTGGTNPQVATSGTTTLTASDGSVAALYARDISIGTPPTSAGGAGSNSGTP